MIPVYPFNVGDTVAFVQWTDGPTQLICYGEIQEVKNFEPTVYLVKEWNGGFFNQHGSTLAKLNDGEALLRKLEL